MASLQLTFLAVINLALMSVINTNVNQDIKISKVKVKITELYHHKMKNRVSIQVQIALNKNTSKFSLGRTQLSRI